eukprot:TRINITY_DN52687_c0_g1_i1.p1 TRINITY_DN52687_c0_g1~~TRINITY_DN52687_c0_g1_i1.p1  ORF type:complete len:415 (+),score=36.66 TRINITY_DN52687_c0_g1_i1:35-1279(+)
MLFLIIISLHLIATNGWSNTAGGVQLAGNSYNSEVPYAIVLANNRRTLFLNTKAHYDYSQVWAFDAATGHINGYSNFTFANDNSDLTPVGASSIGGVWASTKIDKHTARVVSSMGRVVHEVVLNEADPRLKLWPQPDAKKIMISDSLTYCIVWDTTANSLVYATSPASFWSNKAHTEIGSFSNIPPDTCQYFLAKFSTPKQHVNQVTLNFKDAQGKTIGCKCLFGGVTASTDSNSLVANCQGTLVSWPIGSNSSQWTVPEVPKNTYNSVNLFVNKGQTVVAQLAGGGFMAFSTSTGAKEWHSTQKCNLLASEFYQTQQLPYNAVLHTDNKDILLLLCVTKGIENGVVRGIATNSGKLLPGSFTYTGYNDRANNYAVDPVSGQLYVCRNVAGGVNCASFPLLACLKGTGGGRCHS